MLLQTHPAGRIGAGRGPELCTPGRLSTRVGRPDPPGDPDGDHRAGDDAAGTHSGMPTLTAAPTRLRAPLLTASLTMLLLLLPAAPSAPAEPGRTPVHPAAGIATRPAPGVTGAPSSLGTVVLPVSSPAQVVTPFRPPTDRWGPGHRGVDLAAAPGTPIRAAAAGVIAFAGLVAGHPVVSVAHTAVLRTTYEPVLSTLPIGTVVTAGQVIGMLQDGHPSCSPASCLHWGARVGADHYLDPMALLTGIRVRLKPWD